MPIEGIDYFVRIVPFPRGTKTHGMVVLNDDGTYSVYLDANVDDVRRKSALTHEIAHIMQDDLMGDKSIVQIERVV